MVKTEAGITLSEGSVVHYLGPLAEKLFKVGGGSPSLIVLDTGEPPEVVEREIARLVRDYRGLNPQGESGAQWRLFRLTTGDGLEEVTPWIKDEAGLIRFKPRGRTDLPITPDQMVRVFLTIMRIRGNRKPGEEKAQFPEIPDRSIVLSPSNLGLWRSGGTTDRWTMVAEMLPGVTAARRGEVKLVLMSDPSSPIPNLGESVLVHTFPLPDHNRRCYFLVTEVRNQLVGTTGRGGRPPVYPGLEQLVKVEDFGGAGAVSASAGLPLSVMGEVVAGFALGESEKRRDRQGRRRVLSGDKINPSDLAAALVEGRGEYAGRMGGGGLLECIKPGDYEPLGVRGILERFRAGVRRYGLQNFVTPRTMLLTGLPGGGKTTFAEIIANEIRAAGEVQPSCRGSELMRFNWQQMLRDAFVGTPTRVMEQALALIEQWQEEYGPLVVLVDEWDKLMGHQRVGSTCNVNSGHLEQAVPTFNVMLQRARGVEKPPMRRLIIVVTTNSLDLKPEMIRRFGTGNIILISPVAPDRPDLFLKMLKVAPGIIERNNAGTEAPIVVRLEEGVDVQFVHRVMRKRHEIFARDWLPLTIDVGVELVKASLPPDPSERDGQGRDVYVVSKESLLKAAPRMNIPDLTMEELAAFWATTAKQAIDAEKGVALTPEEFALTYDIGPELLKRPYFSLPK